MSAGLAFPLLKGELLHAARERCRDAAFYLAWASAVSIIASIAVSQTLLGLGLLALLLSGDKLLFPPVKLPLALFFTATVASILASEDPAHGLPQLRKFYVFLTLVVIFNTFRTARQMSSLVLGWAAVASVSAFVSVAQFARLVWRADPAQLRDYGYFLYNRTTGLASHWMTFGGEGMIVLLMLLSWLCFSRDRGKTPAWICAAALFVALVLGLTRSVFLVGLPAGAVYLIWRRKRRLLIAVPLVIGLMYGVAPMPVRERAASLLAPHKDMDSNTLRIISLRTGLAMVRAHPWLGLGPEQVGRRFDQYVPADVPRPIPQGWHGHLHNIYLQYAAERGIPAMLLMMWFLAKVIRDCLVSARRGELRNSFVLHGATAVTLAVLAEGCFEHNLGDSEILTLFLTVTACVYAELRAAAPAKP